MGLKFLVIESRFRLNSCSGGGGSNRAKEGSIPSLELSRSKNG